MARNKYYRIKQDIKDAIRTAYGTFTAFCLANPHKGYTPQNLSGILDPSKGCNIASLIDICEVIGVEISITGVPKKAA